MTPEPNALQRPASPAQLFIAFTLLALQGFGGVLAIAQRVLCEQRRWLTQQEFLEMLSVGQVLPGPNVCNVALMVGDRFFGLRGALAAPAGMMMVPLVLVLSLAALYVNFSDVPQVAGALRGMSAVAAGLIVGTALKLAAGLRHGPLHPAASVSLAVAAFGAIALLRWPLPWVLLALGAAGWLLAWRGQRR